MRLEVELRDVDEAPADDRVDERPGLEGAHEPLAIGAILDVVELAARTHAKDYGGSVPACRLYGSVYAQTAARAYSPAAALVIKALKPRPLPRQS